MVEDGSALLLSYEQPQSHRKTTRYERRLACYNVADGSPRWETGGAFTGAPLFAAAAGDGRFIVALGARQEGRLTDLRLLNGAGRKLAAYPTPAPVCMAAASADGTRIATYGLDGSLAFVRVLHDGLAPDPSAP
jgi:hypothetical protein